MAVLLFFQAQNPRRCPSLTSNFRERKRTAFRKPFSSWRTKRVNPCFSSCVQDPRNRWCGKPWTPSMRVSCTLQTRAKFQKRFRRCKKAHEKDLDERIQNVLKRLRENLSTRAPKLRSDKGHVRFGPGGKRLKKGFRSSGASKPKPLGHEQNLENT